MENGLSIVGYSCTLISMSVWLSQTVSTAFENLTTLGTETCRWNSENSMAVMKMTRRSLIEAFNVGIGSFLLKIYQTSLEKKETRRLTRSMGNTTVIHDCAESIIIFCDKMEVLWARQRPAQRAPASLECKSASILVGHLTRCEDGRRHSAVREERQ